MFSDAVFAGSHPINNKDTLSVSVKWDRMRFNLGYIYRNEEAIRFVQNERKTGGDPAKSFIEQIIANHHDILLDALRRREDGVEISMRI